MFPRFCALILVSDGRRGVKENQIKMPGGPFYRSASSLLQGLLPSAYDIDNCAIALKSLCDHQPDA